MGFIVPATSILYLCFKKSGEKGEINFAEDHIKYIVQKSEGNHTAILIPISTTH